MRHFFHLIILFSWSIFEGCLKLYTCLKTRVYKYQLLPEFFTFCHRHIEFTSCMKCLLRRLINPRCLFLLIINYSLLCYLLHFLGARKVSVVVIVITYSYEVFNHEFKVYILRCLLICEDRRIYQYEDLVVTEVQPPYLI